MARSVATKRPVTLRLSPELREAIQEIMQRTGRDFSSVAHEMLSEAVKMRRIPGIVFADTPSGRQARVAGTGIDVWEIARDYRELGKSWEALGQRYHWLNDRQLRAALAYAEAYPEEIEARLALEERVTPEFLYAKYPFMKPPWR